MERKLAVSMFGQKRLSREGGIEIVVKELCTRMVQNGCTVLVCSCSPCSSSLLSLMATYLLISFPHCCTIQIVGSFQNGVLSEFLLETKHCILQLLLFFQLRGIREQVDLEEALIFDHTVGSYCDPSYRQGFISYSLEQLSCGRDQDASEVGRIIQFCAAMSTFRNSAAVVIDVHRTSVLSAVAVFPVITHIQCQAVRNQTFVRQL